MSKKKTGGNAGTRTRVNPLTGDRETVTGPKAGRNRFRLSWGDPLRTHDLPAARRKAKPDHAPVIDED